MSADENKAFIRHWVEQGWNQGDLGLVETYFAADYQLHDPAMPPLPPGPQGFRGFMAALRAAFPDLHYAIEDMVAEGDRVVWRATLTGTHRGEFNGIPATNRTVRVSGMILSRLAAGQFAEDWSVVDMLGLLQQLGVIPAPGA